MLARGAAVESQMDGETALLYAGRLERPKSFRFLLDNGADITACASKRVGKDTCTHCISV